MKCIHLITELGELGNLQNSSLSSFII